MKRLLIAVALSITFMACNSGTKTEVSGDTSTTGENSSSAAQQSSADTNVNKIGTGNSMPDTVKKDSLKKK